MSYRVSDPPPYPRPCPMEFRHLVSISPKIVPTVEQTREPFVYIRCGRNPQRYVADNVITQTDESE